VDLQSDVKALPHSRLHACSRWEHSGHTAPMIKKAFQRMAKYMFPSVSARVAIKGSLF
jgi:hypothetical protein